MAAGQTCDLDAFTRTGPSSALNASQFGTEKAVLQSLHRAENFAGQFAG